MKPPVKQQTIEQLANIVAEAFATKGLSKLDNKRYLLGKVRISIKHSLAGDDAPNRSEDRDFKTFALGEKWLASREHDGLPARESRPLLTCQKSICVYNFQQGILHNHLYLQKIAYGYKNSRPYIKTIYLLDGD
jgi:hypothetical protein